MEKVRVYVRVNFASGGCQGATPETDSESCTPSVSKTPLHASLVANVAEYCNYLCGSFCYSPLYRMFAV